MRFMVHHSQKGMQQHLIATLYRDNLASELLQEREDVAKARIRCRAAVEALTAAMETLEDVPAELTSTLLNSEASDGPGAPGGGGGAGPMGKMMAGTIGEGGRHALSGADRHPSMHIAAQIATATTLTMAPVGGGFREVAQIATVREEDGSAVQGMVEAVMNGVKSSVHIEEVGADGK
jgi:hypothetical protein